MAKPELGWHHTVLPVTTASVAVSRTATAVTPAAHTWSPSMTVPMPPSARIPIFPLFDAALYSTVVPDPGAMEPPDAEAPVASGRPLRKKPSPLLCSDMSPSSRVFCVAWLTANPLAPLRTAELETTVVFWE